MIHSAPNHPFVSAPSDCILCYWNAADMLRRLPSGKLVGICCFLFLRLKGFLWVSQRLMVNIFFRMSCFVLLLSCSEISTLRQVIQILSADQPAKYFKGTSKRFIFDTLISSFKVFVAACEITYTHFSFYKNHINIFEPRDS